MIATFAAVLMYIENKLCSFIFDILSMAQFMRINNCLILNRLTGALHISIKNTHTYKKYSYINETHKIAERLQYEVYEGFSQILKLFRDGLLNVKSIWGISHKTFINEQLTQIFKELMSEDEYEITFVSKGKKCYAFECIPIIKFKELMDKNVLDKIFRDRESVLFEIRKKASYKGR